MVAFQSTKRKEKERYPGGVFALLQRERDTKTSSSISSETLARETQQTTGKPINDRAPALRLFMHRYRRRMAQVATTTLGIHRPP